MKEYLVFRLYGPMASWGQAAVGGDRPTGLQPTRSAIIGLLASALGIKRDNETLLQQLQSSIQIAVKQCVPSSLLRDYHTTQVPIGNSDKLAHCLTRKSEIDELKRQEKYNSKNSRPNAILSSRDYRCDGLWVIAISLTDVAEYSLLALSKALLKPTFVLYLGRKSCPLSLPVLPTLVSVEMLKEALDTQFKPILNSEKEDNRWLGANKMVTYYWQGSVDEFNNKKALTTYPWDEPVNRTRWQFKQRTQHQLTIAEE